MIDFNTILNQLFVAAIEEAQKPLLEKIEVLEKRVTDMDAFFAAWNFNDLDTFALKVSQVVVDRDNDTVRGYLGSVVRVCVEDEFDVDDKIEAWVENWWRHLDISDDVEKAVSNADFPDEDRVNDMIEQFINDKVTISIS